MARIRTIKPTLWESEKLGRCSLLARLTFIGLISLADDEGRGRGELRYLLGHLHPYAGDVNETELDKSIKQLETRHLVAFYDVDSCRYYALPGWRSHQCIDRWRTSDLPSVPAEHPMSEAFALHSSNVRRTLGEDSANVRPGKGMEGKGMEGITTAPRGADAVHKSLPTTTKASAAADYSDVRLPFGPRKGVCIINLPADECAYILRTMRGLGEKVKAALKWRIDLKAAEMTPAQRRAHGGK